MWAWHRASLHTPVSQALTPLAVPPALSAVGTWHGWAWPGWARLDVRESVGDVSTLSPVPDEAANWTSGSSVFKMCVVTALYRKLSSGMSGSAASCLLELVPRCLDQLRGARSTDQTARGPGHALPLRLEKLEQHGVSVEPLGHCLCNLGGRKGPKVRKESSCWGVNWNLLVHGTINYPMFLKKYETSTLNLHGLKIYHLLTINCTPWWIPHGGSTLVKLAVKGFFALSSLSHDPKIKT